MAIIRNLPLSLRMPLIQSTIGALTKFKLNPKAAQFEDVKPGSIVVSGFYNQMTGIGRAARQTLASLWRESYPVIDHELVLSAGSSLRGRLELPGQDGVWLIHANAPETSMAMMAHCQDSWQNRYRIGYWAWETPLVPKSWVDVARLLHEIWVPSQYVFNSLTKGFLFNDAAELINRIRLMPHLVSNTSQAKPPRGRFGRDEKKCEVLCLFDVKSSVARKNPWASLKAWTRAFPEPSHTARLTLKVNLEGETHGATEALQSLSQNRPDIVLMTETLNDKEIQEFIGSFDILISLHRSEGFALSIAEAMEAGVAVIATNYSGNTDYMNENNSVPVPYHLVPIDDRNGPYSMQNGRADQVWAEPDIGYAAKALKGLIQDKSLRVRLGEQARIDLEGLKHNWTRENLERMSFHQFVADRVAPAMA